VEGDCDLLVRSCSRFVRRRRRLFLNRRLLLRVACWLLLECWLVAVGVLVAAVGALLLELFTHVRELTLLLLRLGV